MSNFGFLRAEWPDLHAEAARAEQFAAADPRASCFYARRTLELTVTWLYQADSSLKRPYRDDLAAMIAEPKLVQLAELTIRTKMRPHLHTEQPLKVRRRETSPRALAGRSSQVRQFRQQDRSRYDIWRRRS